MKGSLSELIIKIGLYDLGAIYPKVPAFEHITNIFNFLKFTQLDGLLQYGIRR